jgi:hypothetical protein
VTVNLEAQHKEIWIRDPDGFVVVLAGPDGKTRGHAKFLGRDERNFSPATAIFSISRSHLRQRRNQT